PALSVLIVCKLTPSYNEDEFKAFYIGLERFYRVEHTFFKVITRDFTAKIGGKRMSRNFTLLPTDWTRKSRNF
ncbi:hypothetical protein Angca_001726, partial [Angiostrongylus cantonensis]